MNLLELPPDMLIKILQYLTLADLSRISRTSSTAFNIIANLSALIHPDSYSIKNKTILHFRSVNEHRAHRPIVTGRLAPLSILQSEKAFNQAHGVLHLENDLMAVWIGNRLEFRDRLNPDYLLEPEEGHSRQINGALTISETDYSLQLYKKIRGSWDYPFRRGAYLYLCEKGHVTYQHINYDYDGDSTKRSHIVAIPEEALSMYATEVRDVLTERKHALSLEATQFILHYVAAQGAPMPTTSKIVTWSDDGTLKMWEVETQKCLATANAGPSPIIYAAYPHVGFKDTPRYIYSLSADHTFRIWDPKTMTCRASLMPSKLTSDRICWDLEKHLPLHPLHSVYYDGVNLSRSNSNFHFWFEHKAFTIECVDEPPSVCPMGVLYLDCKEDVIHFKALAYYNKLREGSMCIRSFRSEEALSLKKAMASNQLTAYNLPYLLKHAIDEVVHIQGSGTASMDRYAVTRFRIEDLKPYDIEQGERPVLYQRKW